MNNRQIFAVAMMVAMAAAGPVRADPIQPPPPPNGAYAYKVRPPVRVLVAVPRPVCTLFNNCLALVGAGP